MDDPCVSVSVNKCQPKRKEEHKIDEDGEDYIEAGVVVVVVLCEPNSFFFVPSGLNGVSGFKLGFNSC